MKPFSLPRRCLHFILTACLFAALLPASAQAAAAYDYVIVTTSTIKNNSLTALGAFITHKQSLGYHPIVITESDYDPSPMNKFEDRPEKIRAWLSARYASWGIRYVLLIGNPDPYDPSLPNDLPGDLPMKLCRPSGAVPTDAFYADLSGNWDADGDGVPCGWGDFTPGGIRLAGDVSVGRIPVYNNDYAALSAFLQKIIQYETSADTAWRRSALLPMNVIDSQTDGAYLSEEIKTNLLDPGGFSSYRMYPAGNGTCALASYTSGDADLRGGTQVLDRWKASPPGLVVWWANGSPDRAQVGYSGCLDGDLFAASDAAGLDSTHPAVVTMLGADYNRPETAANLGYNLLKNGAVGAVSATRPPYNIPAEQSFAGSGSAAGIGYEFNRRVIENQALGAALLNARAAVTVDQAEKLANALATNLYGDPSLRLSTVLPYPTPAIASLSPDHIRAASGGFTLTVSGTNFVPQSQVRWNGSSLATTYASAAQLTAQVPAENIASEGSASITVANLDAGGKVSQPLVLTIDPPAGSCSPAANIYLDGSDSGRNDRSGSTQEINLYPGVDWNESGPEVAYRFTAPASGTVAAALSSLDSSLDLFVLDGALPCAAANLLAYGDDQVEFNAQAGHEYFLLVDGRGGAAGSYTLSLTCAGCSNPAPVLAALSPWSAVPQSEGLALQLTGSGFTGASIARWQGEDLPTTYIDSEHLSAQVPAGKLSAPGAVEVTVFNPAPGGGESSPLLFTIQAADSGGCLPVSDLAPGQTVTASNGGPGSTDRIDSYPGVLSSLDGPEIAYRLSVPASETVTLDLYNAPAGLSLFVVDGSSGACQAGNLVASGKKLVGFGAVGNRDYYVIIDGENGAAGSFTLSARCPGCQNPGPSITAFDPPSAPAGNPGFTLRLFGEDFAPGSTARWDGFALDTTYLSPTELSAVVPAVLASLPGTAGISVTNPGAEGRSSPPYPFTLTLPPAGQCFPAVEIQPGKSDTRRTTAPGSTDQIDAYPLGAKLRTGPEFAYRFTPSVDGWVTARLSGLSVDLDLFILDGSSGLCRPDDANILASQVTAARFLASAGKPYYIIVDGYRGASGSYTLAVSDAARTPENSSAVDMARPVFTWPRVEAATGYILQISTHADGTLPFLSRTVTDPRAAMTTDLPRGKTLYWRTIPLTGTRRGTPSELWSFASANPIPAPALIYPASGALLRTLQPRLDWSTPKVPLGTQFGRYELQIGLDSYFTRTILTTNVSDLSSSELTLPTPLAANRAYYWRVRAWNSGGQVSPWSAARSFRTALPAPVPVSPLEGESQTPDQHAFAWDPVAGASSYTLQVSYSPTFKSVLFSVSVKTSNYTRILKSARPFYWRVRANGTNGPSNWSPIRSFYDTH